MEQAVQQILQQIQSLPPEALPMLMQAMQQMMGGQQQQQGQGNEAEMMKALAMQEAQRSGGGRMR